MKSFKFYYFLALGIAMAMPVLARADESELAPAAPAEQVSGPQAGAAPEAGSISSDDSSSQEIVQPIKNPNLSIANDQNSDDIEGATQDKRAMNAVGERYYGAGFTTNARQAAGLKAAIGMWRQGSDSSLSASLGGSPGTRATQDVLSLKAEASGLSYTPNNVKSLRLGPFLDGRAMLGSNGWSSGGTAFQIAGILSYGGIAPVSENCVMSMGPGIGGAWSNVYGATDKARSPDQWTKALGFGLRAGGGCQWGRIGFEANGFAEINSLHGVSNNYPTQYFGGAQAGVHVKINDGAMVMATGSADFDKRDAKIVAPENSKLGLGDANIMFVGTDEFILKVFGKAKKHRQPSSGDAEAAR
jgi:hypothetical protein